MINLITAILFSFSANLDNIVIGISYGVKKIHLSLLKILIVCIFTTLFTFTSMFLGSYLINIFNENIANSLGAYILIILGIYTLTKELFTKLKDKNYDIYVEHRDKCIKNINLKDLFMVIFILSTNNIASGIAASATGINIITTSIFSFIFGFILLLFGNLIGKKIINTFVQTYSNILASFLLILIRLY